VWKINNQIMNLPEKHHDALLVWYAVNVKDTGGYWEPAEKAERLGWTLNAFKIRVSRARRFLFRKAYLTDRHKTEYKGAPCIIAS
jgi:DNA-directed RNA polymerase specialized sigma24 family protein